ncbi:hypothetical protein SV7mr_32880 [Stieleria bergensis]|uniref:Uncharacterized protein n=1 Tax=Stieleria bergensis TaxID=2528025 RepID=A0A517SX92_9BACT|nr:hypothetical protein SV7mr_32880 [Planctomycetes bacterium SV_7m_r]
MVSGGFLEPPAGDRERGPPFSLAGLFFSKIGGLLLEDWWMENPLSSYIGVGATSASDFAFQICPELWLC